MIRDFDSVTLSLLIEYTTQRLNLGFRLMQRTQRKALAFNFYASDAKKYASK